MPLIPKGVPRRDIQSPIEIALINNMPDPVLEDTESQFSDLLAAASGDIPVRLSLFSLPNIPRCERAETRIANAYHGLDRLWNGRFDAVIVTGTEPRHADLRQEPYWQPLVDVLNWAEENTASTILSCLAAHAGVLHSEGATRQPLAEKQFGVFSFERRKDHWMTQGMGEAINIPHSRWNELSPQTLRSCGYTILTEAVDAGVDLFVKQKKQSLFVHFQGHPEYRQDTLLKEYRRDIRRFLKGAREDYPSQPRGYFDSEASRVLRAFREHAMTRRCEQTMASFPEEAVTSKLLNTWLLTSQEVYRNWLFYVALCRTKTRPHSAVPQTRAFEVSL